MEYLTEAKKDALKDLYAVWDELGHMPSVDEFNRSTIIRHVGDTKPSGRLSIAFGSPPEAFRAAARYRDDIEARKIIDPKYDPDKPLKIKPAEPEPEPEPEPELKSELGPELESESAPESEPEPKPEPEPESNPKPHSTKQRQHRGVSRRSKSYRDSEEARYALQDELEKPEPSYSSICDQNLQKDANGAPEKPQECLAASSGEAGEEYVEYEELSNAEINSETNLESASTENALAPPLEVAEETIAEKEETFMEVGLATEDKIILNTLNKTLYVVKSDGTMAIVQRTGLATAMTGKINVGSVAGIPIAKIFTMPTLIRDEELHEFPEKKDNIYYVVPIEVAEAANEIGRATDDLLYPLDYDEDEEGAIYCREFGRL